MCHKVTTIFKNDKAKGKLSEKKIHRLVRSGKRGAVAVGIMAAIWRVPYFLALAEKWTTVRRYQNLHHQKTTLMLGGERNRKQRIPINSITP